MALTDKLSAIGDAIRVQSGKTDLLTLDQMPTEIIDLQALAFDVVINPQPETAKENTIWVNTDIPIPSWHFTATQPENMADGEAWFRIDPSGSVAFNALKKNSVMVYPISANQYVGGALVDVEAKIYQGGEWNEFISTIWLYDNGVRHVEWEHSGPTGDVTEDGTSTGSTPYLYLQSSQANSSGYWVTKDPISGARLKGRKLFADVSKWNGSTGSLWIGLVPSKNSTSPVASIDLNSQNYTGLCETELGDIPDGEYYVKAYIYVTTGSMSRCKIFQVYIDD